MKTVEFVNLVKVELPHIKYVINSLHSQGLSSGALPEIYNNLKHGVENIKQDDDVLETKIEKL